MTKIIHCIIINHYELLRTLINKYKHGYTVFLLNIICCAILLNNVGINIYFMIIPLPIYFKQKYVFGLVTNIFIFKLILRNTLFIIMKLIK